jgi:DNA-binding MarR family transcriptional regulator
VSRTGVVAAANDESPGGGLDFGELRNVAGFHLARATVSTDAAFETHIGLPFDLRKVEFSMLMLLLANDHVSPKPLARTLRVTAPKLTLLLDGLQARGLLQRHPNPEDGRSQHVLLTEKGHRLAHQAAAASKVMEAEVRQPLSAAEHALLNELLDKLSRPVSSAPSHTARRAPSARASGR